MADEQINPLVKLIQERLPWLFSDAGFRTVDYSSDRLGNCSALLESERLRLSFAQDRNFTQVRLASRADLSKAYELGFLMLALKGARPDVGFEGSAALLKDNWPLLEEAPGPQLAETRREYERREQVSAEHLARIRAGSGVPQRKVIQRVGKGLLRLWEATLILWALYIVFTHRAG